MPFHRNYPVRTYQSLMKDLEERADERPVKAEGRSDWIWREAYKALIRLTLRELEEIAEYERADIPEWDGFRMKAKYANAIIAARKRRLRALGHDV